MGNLILAFDIYGTILDTSAVSGAVEKQLGLLSRLSGHAKEKALEITASWRKYQLEYTWRLNSMGTYEDFDVVTRKSLEHAGLDAGVELDEKAIDALMKAYYELPSYSDAAPAWKELSNQEGVELVIFSNGTETMVSAALHSARLSPAPPPSSYILADEVQRYKPAPELYTRLLQRTNTSSRPESVCLISSNPFDVVGACAAGFNALWVDRAGAGWADRLGSGAAGRSAGAPTHIVRGLGDIASYVRAAQT